MEACKDSYIPNLRLLTPLLYPCLSQSYPTDPFWSRSLYSGFAPANLDKNERPVEDNIVALFNAIGTLDHIIYLAGDRLPPCPLPDITLGKWQSANQVRTIAAILVVKHGIHHLRTQTPACSIIFTGGSISEKPIPGGWAMLAMMGAGINGLTRQLAFDLAPVRVNCVAPGVVETDLWEGMGAEGKRAFFREHEKGTLTGSVAQAEDVAESYLYLLRDENATGVVVHSNSGVLLK